MLFLFILGIVLSSVGIIGAFVMKKFDGWLISNIVVLSINISWLLEYLKIQQ